MRYLSVCSGIEAASVAWETLGWTAAAFSEIEPFPRKVLAHRFPEVPLHGDFTQIPQGAVGPIDLLVGGTPCQAFSVAGLREGLRDPRGNLALGFLGLADRERPRWIVWENVPGVLSSNGGRDFGAFLGGLGQLGYGWAYRVLDAQHFGVPQQRRRVFVVGCLGDAPRARAVLFERASLRRDPASGRAAREGVAQALTGSPYGDRGDGDEAKLIAPTICARGNRTGGTRPPGTSADDCGILIAAPLAASAQRLGLDCETYVPAGGVAFGGNRTSGPLNVATACNAHGGPHGRLDFETETFIASTGVRRLTPRECERLQGFPDDWTAIPGAADGPRYKAIGNSMAVPVMRWIGERIALVDAVPSELLMAAE